MKKFFIKNNKYSNGFTRLVDFGDAISSRTKSASPKFTTGFTLVESLVAISIFTMSVLVLLVSLSQGLSDTNYAKEKITAEYLNQEGIEYMRNMRDTYMLYSSDTQAGWDDFIANLTGNNCDAANGCYFDADNLFSLASPMPMTRIDLNACGASCQEMKYDSATGKYGYTSGNNSGFTRKINVEQISVDEIKILSTISWNQRSGSYQVTFSENLYNWIQ